MQRTLRNTCLVVVFVLFAWFVWPTPYRYDHLGDVPMRIHRVTGAAELWSGFKGWVAYPVKGGPR